MIIVGWLVWTVQAFIAVSWTFGIVYFLQSGKGVTYATMCQTACFWLILFVCLFTKINKLHILWVAPVSWALLAVLVPALITGVPIRHFIAGAASAFTEEGEEFARKSGVLKELEESEEDENTILLQGLAHFEAGRYEKAVELYSKAITSNPGKAQLYLLRGHAYWKQEMLDASVKDYKKALKLKPDYPDAHIGLGVAAHAKGDIKAALKNFDKACNMGAEKACELARMLRQENR